MAKVKTVSGAYVGIAFENPDAAGTFLKPCGLDAGSISFTKKLGGETEIFDCDDPELPAWIERQVSSLELSINGSGLLDITSVDRYWDIFSSNISVNARVYIGRLDDTANGRYWDGKVHMTEFKVDGERKEVAKTSISAVSDGEMTLKQVA